jgi:hypothetical protein
MAVILHSLVSRSLVSHPVGSHPVGLYPVGLHPVGLQTVGSHGARAHAAILQMDEVWDAMNGFKPPWFDHRSLRRGTAQTAGGQISIELGRRERS